MAIDEQRKGHVLQRQSTASDSQLGLEATKLGVAKCRRS